MTVGASDPILEVPGGKELVEWFGRVPRFHDAEILRLSLDRKGDSFLEVHTWAMTSQIDARGYFVLDKHVVVTFLFGSISGLKLDGFWGQNVIDRLLVRRYDSGCEFLGTEFTSCATPDADHLGVVFEPTFGVGGAIYARGLRIEFKLGAP